MADNFPTQTSLGAFPIASRRAWRMLGLTAAIAMAIVTVGHADLWVSALFHDGTAFPLRANPGLEVLRDTVWTASIALVLLALVALALAALRRPSPVPARLWAFILALYALGPGLLVEEISKPLWGRARPADTLDFGGSLPFSLPTDLVGHCTRNCSFMSGEVAGATVLAIAVMVLRPYLHARIRLAVMPLAVLIPAFIAFQRVASGRHFLSDAVVAVLLMLLLALCLAPLFAYRASRQSAGTT